MLDPDVLTVYLREKEVDALLNTLSDVLDLIDSGLAAKPGKKTKEDPASLERVFLKDAKEALELAKAAHKIRFAKQQGRWPGRDKQEEEY